MIGCLLALGIVLAVASGDVSEVLAPITALFDLIRWFSWAVAIAWGPLVLAAPVGEARVMWAIGRRSGPVPNWVMPAAQRSEADAPITPSIVVAALRDLGYAALCTAIKDMPDAGAAMLGAYGVFERISQDAVFGQEEGAQGCLGHTGVSGDLAGGRRLLAVGSQHLCGGREDPALGCTGAGIDGLLENKV